MTADLINKYLDWLLRRCSSVISQDSDYSLRAEFDKSEFSGGVGDVNKLRISGRSTPQLAVAVADETNPKKTIATSKIVREAKYQFEQARSVAEAIFGKKKTDSLVDSLGPNEYLTVDAAISVKGRRTVDSKNKMSELADELADMTDAKIQVEGKDGKLSDGDAILRTRMPFELSHSGSNFLELDNVSDQIQTVYKRFVEDKKIQA